MQRRQTRLAYRQSDMAMSKKNNVVSRPDAILHQSKSTRYSRGVFISLVKHFPMEFNKFACRVVLYLRGQ